MPSSFNATSTTDTTASGNASGVAPHATDNKINVSTTSWYDPASNLGYGVGRLLKGAFDLAVSTWESWWNPTPGFSPKETAKRRQDIYEAGLKKCVQHLEVALANLRKNPRDPASLKKIEELAKHYAPYVIWVPTAKLSAYQQQLFKPLIEQIERLVDPILKQRVKTLLPVVPLGSKEQDEDYLSKLTQAYYGEETRFKAFSGSSPSKEKRSIEQVAFLTSFNLSALNGANGFTVPGITGDLGYSVSTAGDINGDNITDLVLGAPTANAGNGTAYVIFGNRAGFGSTFNLATLNGTNGFTIPSIVSGSLGYSVSTAGDINGDNITDLVLGAPTANSLNGTAYVIFGNRAGFGSTFNLATLNGANGFTIPSIVSGGELGYSVSTAGDINGDNLTDLILGAPDANLQSGTAYVIFGSRRGFGSTFDLTALNGTNGFTILSIIPNGYLGYSASTAGDINGDGFSDLVLGAYYANANNNGAAYVIFGNRSGFGSTFNLSALNGANGFTVPGIALHGYLGSSVNTAGDINGDGIADLVLGAYYANSGNGTSYVIFGSRRGFSSTFNLAALNGTNGFTIRGIASSSELGSSVSTAGDINGDGIADLVLGAYNANAGNGTAYVIFGHRGGFGSTFNLTTLNSTNGFTIPSVVLNGGLGSSVSTAGDINGDNIADLVLGAYYANSANGTAYVIFGQSTMMIPTPVTTPVPPSTTNLTSCPSNQPLTLGNYHIQINQGQNLRLTPNDLSASCGNSTIPNLGTAFTVTGITHAQVQTRHSMGPWNNASNFLGTDLSQGNVAFVQDNTTFPPELNISVTDGKTLLTSPVGIQFSTNQSMLQITNITFTINTTGTTLLNASQFQIIDTGTNLDNVVISVSFSQGGYFSTTSNSTQPITDFTYYQLQNGQIQFVQNGTILPNVTFSVGDGSGQSVPFKPLIGFFNAQQANSKPLSIGIIAGVVGGVVAAAAVAGILFFKLKYKPEQERSIARYRAQNQRVERSDLTSQSTPVHSV